MRGVLGVVSGYVIFAGSAVLYFRLANVDPHSPAVVSFEMLTLAYGLAFALLGGFVAGKVARRTDLMSGILLALVIALGATVSIIARPGARVRYGPRLPLCYCSHRRRSLAIGSA